MTHGLFKVDTFEEKAFISAGVKRSSHLLRPVNLVDSCVHENEGCLIGTVAACARNGHRLKFEMFKKDKIVTGTVTTDNQNFGAKGGQRFVYIYIYIYIYIYVCVCVCECVWCLQ